MKTHKHITDLYERYLVILALRELKNVDKGDTVWGYIFYPFGNNKYGAYDARLGKLIKVEYTEYGTGIEKTIELNQ